MDKINIEKMAELLRSGNTMLNKSCPECNSPIFKNRKGELFCPSCNRKILIINKTTQQEIKKIQKNQIKKKTQILNNDKDDLINQTINSLKEKLIWILKIMKKEEQAEQIKKYIKLLKEIYELIFLLSDKKL